MNIYVDDTGRYIWAWCAGFNEGEKCAGRRFINGKTEHTCSEPCRFIMGKDGTAPTEDQQALGAIREMLLFSDRDVSIDAVKAIENALGKAQLR